MGNELEKGYGQEDESLLVPQLQLTGRRKYLENRMVSFLVFVLIVSLTANTVALLQWPATPKLDLDSVCSRYTSTHNSPLLDDVGIEYKPVNFTPSFHHPNIYQGDPSPEVDEAWDALGVDITIIPEEMGEQAGLAGRLKRTPETGGGYLAAVEVMHHLHCLNFLRKSLWFNADYYKELGTDEFVNREPLLKTHVNHCVDALRQQLQCTADFNLFGYVSIDGGDTFPDFGTLHMCKNFDAIRDWARERQYSPHLETRAREGDIVLKEMP